MTVWETCSWGETLTVDRGRKRLIDRWIGSPLTDLVYLYCLKSIPGLSHAGGSSPIDIIERRGHEDIHNLECPAVSQDIRAM